MDLEVILISFEGAEFSLLYCELFSALKKSIIFIELHDWIFKGGKKKMTELLPNAKPFFKISTLATSSRDLSKFPELFDYEESNRWLIAKEGRPKLMTCLRLDPRETYTRPN